MKIKMKFQNGKVEVDVEGGIGKKCVETTEEILQVLNIKTERRKLKPEYYIETTREYEYEG